MAFESLSESYEFEISDFPSEWLPLTYLYDPDLPLFPIQYFHFTDPELDKNHRPGERDRLFGFIHHINLNENNLLVNVVINKDLNKSHNKQYIRVLEDTVKKRLGLGDPVRLEDIRGTFQKNLAHANSVLEELWYKVIDGSFGKSLPFGKVWDPVFGLVRFVASWNSSGGRKGELIQTHSFVSAFGTKIQTGSDIHVDFYLLPTFEELRDLSNGLHIFSEFSELVAAAKRFTERYCNERIVGRHSYSAFDLSKAKSGSKLKTEVVLNIIRKAPEKDERALFENYSAFDRGPQRSIIFLMMLDDLRNSRWDPASFTPDESGEMYPMLKGAYQTPKVIQLYAQQCFGNEAVLPIDNWVETFLKWPFEFHVNGKKREFHTELFKCCSVWGKIERLIWIAAQARKVHSSVCSEILWCVRYGSPKEGKTPGKLRGANPLACKICDIQIRDACPSYKAISSKFIAFNKDLYMVENASFNVVTSKGNNKSEGQQIRICEGPDIKDIYSTRDRPTEFKSFPAHGHNGSNISVSDFIDKY